jgi:HlyD family secretion protein
LLAAEFALAKAGREEEVAAARLRTPANGARVVEVRSPVAGVVLKRYRESESIVTAGEPVIEVGDPQQLEAVVDLLSTDAVRVRPGLAVSIEGWGGEAPLRGKVQRVEPSGFLKVSALGVEEQRVNVIIDFDDADVACQIGDRYRIEARITIWQSEKAVKVPVGSLFRHEAAWAVFVEQEGRARLRVVKIGQRNNEVGEVIEGLRDGDRVILHPPDTLIDGSRIRPRP